MDGVREIGSGSVPQRLWAKPAITVIGIDTTPIDKASNTLDSAGAGEGQHACRAGGDAEEHLAALTRHLEQNAPWGAQVTVTPGDVGQPYAIDASGAVYDAARSAFRQRVGRAARRHRNRWLHSVHRRVRRGVPVGQDLGDRRGRPCDTSAQRQRKPAPRGAGTCRDRRGAIAGEPGSDGQVAP